MSFESMLNRTCSWTRKDAASVDKYGAQNTDYIEIATGIKCREDDLTQEDIERIGNVGETNLNVTRIFMLGLPDIQVGDRITIVDDTSGFKRKVILRNNAGGHDHHTEVLVERLKIE